MVTIDVLAKRPLRCVVPDCEGSPFADLGYHLVSVIRPGSEGGITDRPDGLSNAACFSCTRHLPDVEAALADYSREHAAEAWIVQTYRMYGWEDDGRGSVYLTESGDPSALF